MKKQNEIHSTPTLIVCPVWHRPLFRIVPTGIEIKCKFCGGLIHTIRREEIEQHWNATTAASPALVEGR